jgi:hypothetical protein
MNSLLPRDVEVGPLCILTGTLGRVELETVAACIVLYHRKVSPDAWIPVTRRQIGEFLPTCEAIKRIIGNPFWRLDLSGFIRGEWISGWELPGLEHADDFGVLTPKFFIAVALGVVS